MLKYWKDYRQMEMVRNERMYLKWVIEMMEDGILYKEDEEDD